MIIKITSDKERAKSRLAMIAPREKVLEELEKIKAYPTKIAEDYYEIIKELCVAIGLVWGFKTIGENAHKEIMEIASKYGEFERADIEIIQDLRVRRNKSSYEGKPIEQIYLDNNKDDLSRIINKLKGVLNNLLE